MLTIKELRKLKPEDLVKELKKAQLKLTQARIDLKTSQDKKSNLARDYKKYCAQILTIQNEAKEEAPTEKDS